MSYQVLARKYRPKNFNQVIGQSHIISALENSLDGDRLHHAYLFAGTRGVGKTTIARLFAKGLNCEQKITANPCNTCANCIASNEGSFIDLLEIDAASRTKVEDTRDLLDNVQYKPVIGRFKVYLIDEVHMLSKHSFNALLKTLEEPPQYVKFLFATTEPQKLPITILSRCIQFNLKAINYQEIFEFLKDVLKQESVRFEDKALLQIAKSAKGSARDALSLTDQAIALTNGNITLTKTNIMLGLIDDDSQIKVLRALINADGDALMECIQILTNKGISAEHFLEEIAIMLHKISMQQLLSETSNLLDKKDDTHESIKEFATQISPENIQLYYQIITHGCKDLPLAPSPQIGLEMTFLRALAFHPTMLNNLDSIKKRDKIGEEIKVKTAEAEVSNINAKPIEKNALQTNSDYDHVLSNDSINNLLKAKQNLQVKKKIKLDKNSNLDIENLEKKNSIIEPNNGIVLDGADVTEYNTPQSYIESLDVDDAYQWTWQNPDLECAKEPFNPKEIKKAIDEQKLSAKMINKINQLAKKRNRLCEIYLSIEISKMAEQLILNSILQEETDKSITVGVLAEFQYLVTKNIIESIQQGMNKFFNKNMILAINVMAENLTDTLITPNKIKKQIFEELKQETKKFMLQDKLLLQIQQEFTAEIDIDSIIPII